MFDAPSVGSGSSIRPADVEGHVLVCEPIEYVGSMSTSFGETDAIRLVVHDISQKESHEDVLWFSAALVGSLKRDIGKSLLGKIGKGEAKAGQSAPWILIDLTSNEKAVAAASKYINERTAGSLSAPSNATASAKAASDLDDLLL